MSTRRRPWWSLATLTAIVLLLGLAVWAWAASLMPSAYSVMDMGTVEVGGGADPGPGGHLHPAAGPGSISVTDLTGPATGRPDVTAELAARQGSFRLASGEQVTGYTIGGTSPGPAIVAHQGDLVQVTLTNVDVTTGVTLHWHGVDVPNAEDGVAGITQDAVGLGGRHVYRFVAEDAGTYWYHSHQVSSDEVRGGLFGTLVVLPRGAVAGPDDVLAPVHSYGGRRTIDGRTGVSTVDAAAGEEVRVRLVNTDNGPLLAWVSGSPFRVAAVDGTDLHGPTAVRDRSVRVTAGGRTDLLVTAPARVDIGGGVALVVGPRGLAVRAEPQPPRTLDMLSYGTPAAIGFDPDRADRSFGYRIGRRIGLVDGKPGFWWTVNGRLFPDVPMFVVREGDVVRMTISNDSGMVHPMHLHGHHALVLSRDGVPSSGSPWWVDSLNVADGESYDIAFVADNPGVWMDHCHNLDHARDGLIAHLMYEGVSTPYEVGGPPGNRPE